MVEATESEAWFDLYISAHGHEHGEAEPDLGVKTNPDRLIRWNGIEVVCEIKQFNSDPFEVFPNRVGTMNLRKALNPVRRAIQGAARQLKPLADSGYPLVVVLANPRALAVPLSPDEILWALYGDPVWRLAIDMESGGAIGDAEYGTDRNGEIRNNHPYLSGVVVLRHRTLAQDWATTNFERITGENPFDAQDAGARMRVAEVAFRSFSDADASGEIPEGDYYFADVFTTMSESAEPLPANVFDGFRDSRWEFDATNGTYVKVR